jgi:hypothetical protein
MQPTSVGGLTNRNDQCTLDLYWKDVRKAYSADDTLLYVGCHYIHKASESDTAWVVWKYTWSGGNCTRIEGPLEGSWTGRASLAWA